MTGRIAIIDPCSAAGYPPAALAGGGLGGTEATILRVATALRPLAEVVHFQNGRTEVEKTGAGVMRPLADASAPMPDATLIVINSWKVACKLRRAHPKARIDLWLHVYPGRHNRPMARALATSGIGVVCVSATHAARLRAFLGEGALEIGFVYNPVADGLAPDGTPREPDRLLFASSPHKGLSQVFAQFHAARAEIPDLTLAVADPGYLVWDTGPAPAGVTFLGALPHHALLAEMRRSLCLFCPQTTFAETFGLVLAEANATGTPVLVHRDVGANAEIVGDERQMVDGNDMAQIVDRLRRWRAAPPAVKADAAFRLATVAERWACHLGLAPASSAAFGRVS